MMATPSATPHVAGKPFRKTLYLIAAAFVLWVVGGCITYVAPPSDANVRASLTVVLDLYSQRLGIVSQLTAIAQDKLKIGTPALAAIAKARAQVIAVPATLALANDPIAFDRFDVAQRQFTDAISALMIEVESERRLASDATVRTLQGKLAVWATRIGSARNRYDEAAQIYNAALHTFPHNVAALLCAEQEKPAFSVPDRPRLRTLPHIDFQALRGGLRV